MPDFSQIMKQAQQMQAKMQEEQEKLSHMEITGTAGAGLVQVTLTGKNRVRTVKIDPSLIVPEDISVLEDLLTAAMNDALSKVEAKMSESMSGILPPGMKLPF